MATTVFLVRHASHDRVSHILCGRMPGVTLGPAGRAEAEALGRRLGRERIGGIFTSPRERARETAEIIGRRLGLEPVTREELDEIDFGAWTGKRFDDLAGDPLWQRWNQTRGAAEPPGGESMVMAQARAVAFMRQLQAPQEGEGAILVSHCDVIKAALLHFLSLPLDAYQLFEISPASVSVLALWQGGSKLLTLNEVAAP